MQQKFEETEPPAQSLSAQSFPTEEQTEIQKPRSLFQSRQKLERKRKDTFRRGQVLLLQTGAYGSLGLALLSISLVSTFVLFMVGVTIWEHFHPTYDTQFNLPGWQIALNVAMMLAPLAIGSCVFCGVGLKARKWATRLDSNLLAHNAADLSASESLLRGSAEPFQEQQEVLLRAAGLGSETPSAHLLRPAEEEKG